MVLGLISRSPIKIAVADLVLWQKLSDIAASVLLPLHALLTALILGGLLDLGCSAAMLVIRADPCPSKALACANSLPICL